MITIRIFDFNLNTREFNRCIHIATDFRYIR